MPQANSEIIAAVAEKLDTYRRWGGSRHYSAGSPIPQVVVRGFLRGTLDYLNQPARRRDLERFHLDTIEESLLAWIASKRTPHRKRIPREYTDDEANELARELPFVLTVLLQHPSPIVIHHEARWLRQELRAYAGASPSPRFQWLKRHSRRILRGLNQVTRCPLISCKRETSLPSEELLFKWAQYAGHVSVGLHFSAYYHGSSFATIRRRHY